jgi:3-phenylpropionate/cinnamic acid dioxygenase small subunit
MKGGWLRTRASQFAAVAVWGLVAGATAGSAFGQSAGAPSAAAQIRAVEDRLEIEQFLMGDYPRALDASDWAAYAAFFAKDGTLIMNGGSTKRTGPAAIEGFFSSQPARPPAASEAACPFAPGARKTMHVVSNLSLHIDQDTATDQAYWETISVRDCKSVVSGAGHYEDVLKREDGHWKFVTREIFDDLPPRTPAGPALAPSKP